MMLPWAVMGGIPLNSSPRNENWQKTRWGNLEGKPG